MKIAILHRYPENEIKPTNASFPYLIKLLREENTVDVKTFRKFNRFRFKLLRSLAWICYAPLLVFNRNYDIIYCDDSFPYYAGLVKLVSPKSLVYKRMGDFHLMYYFNGWVYNFLHWFERIEWNILDMIIPVSSAMADYMLVDGFDQSSPSRMRIILDPIDLDDFKPINAVIKYDVMFHGYLNKNKGLDMLIEAARRLPQYKFCIVGDGPAMKCLKNIPTNIDFIGWVPYKDIKRYIASTRIGIAMRSKNKGNEYVWTQPYLQYSAMGKPVIVSKRKVLEIYPYQFSDIEELHELILEILLDLEFHSLIAKKHIQIEKHDAKLIAKEINDLICLSS